MTSPTPQDPWLLPVAPHPDQAGGKRRFRPLPVVLVSLLALAVLCCGGATLVTVFGPGKAKPVDATASAPVTPAGRPIVAVPTTSSPAAATISPAISPATSPATSTAPVATSPRPARSVTPGPSRTTAKPTTPAPTTPKPKPTKPKPAPTTARPPDKIVHAGAFCSPAGATGVTSKGKAMVCRSTATDSRNRWRAA